MSRMDVAKRLAVESTLTRFEAELILELLHDNEELARVAIMASAQFGLDPVSFLNEMKERLGANARQVQRLNNWSVGASVYDPPELKVIRLMGTLESGKKIITSPVVEVTGRAVRTASGSVYLLGDISPDYHQWMQENNMPYDHEQPIKAVQR